MFMKVGTNNEYMCTREENSDYLKGTVHHKPNTYSSSYINNPQTLL